MQVHKSIEQSKMLVELDCLLDTRLAILFGLSENFAKRAIDNSYYDRLIDDFPNVPFEEFTQLYNNRDKNVLRNAMLTKIAFLMREFVMATTHQILTSPFHMKPVVIVNTYPYEFKDEEADALISVIVSMTSGMADVELVYKPPEQITPAYVKKELSLMVMYEYHKWLELHAENENFKRITCPEVTLIGPALFFKRPTKKELEETQRTGINPFKAVEEMVAPLIGLKLIDVENFSLDVKLERPTQSPK